MWAISVSLSLRRRPRDGTLLHERNPINQNPPIASNARADHRWKNFKVFDRFKYYLLRLRG